MLPLLPDMSQLPLHQQWLVLIVIVVGCASLLVVLLVGLIGVCVLIYAAIDGVANVRATGRAIRERLGETPSATWKTKTVKTYCHCPPGSHDGQAEQGPPTPTPISRQQGRGRRS